ncbi:VacB/RNase II family 3'-5' exoribonuclease [Myxococcota bacterium]|nr:VacB/RNase II family 3'-5' exoribonuclease [Myxococcota bacterium]
MAKKQKKPRTHSRRGPKKQQGKHRQDKSGRPANRGRRSASKPVHLSGRVLLRPDGSGTLFPEGGTTKTLYIPPEELSGVLSGEKLHVEVLTGRKGRLHGRVIKRGKESLDQVVGVISRRRENLVLNPLPRGRSLPVILAGDPEGDDAHPHSQLKAGTVVRARVLNQNNGHPSVEIVEVLGPGKDRDVQRAALIYSLGLKTEFPSEVVQEADAIDDPDLQKALAEGRKDLRQLPLVTIDGLDARDFDDAVAAKREEGGTRLWVAIADVAHYIAAGSELDTEAKERGTSVYFPHKVIPMLPTRLSNGVCSLVADAPRLVLVAEIFFADDGEEPRAHLYSALMQSHARLTYESVQEYFKSADLSAFESQPGVVLAGSKASDELAESLGVMRALASRLRKGRFARGALDLHIPEYGVAFEDSESPTRMRARVQNESHQLIEELMIAANEAVARFLVKKKITAPHRVHDDPDPAALADLAAWAAPFGISLKPNARPISRELRRYVAALRTKGFGEMGEPLLLRAMRQAIYSIEAKPHFGLAARHYLHFTSPIRRYPDLLVHRALHEFWRRAPKQKAKEGSKKAKRTRAMEEDAAQASARERRAMAAEREVVKLFATEIAADNIDKAFDGKITGVLRAGLFIRLDEIGVEGFLPIAKVGSAGEYFDFIAQSYSLRCRRSRKTFSLGDKMRVKIVSANPWRREIDLERVYQQGKPPQKKRR